MGKPFPDLTLFLDASGRFSRSDKFPIVLGGVAIKTSEVDDVRKSLLATTGGRIIKWNEAAQEVRVAKAIFRLLVKRQISAVAKVVKKDRPEWEQYWKVGEDLYQIGIKKAQEALTFAKPSTTLKYHLYGSSMGELFGTYARRHSNLLPLWLPQPYNVQVTVVCDSDIQGADNVRVFRNIFREIGELPQTEAVMKLRPNWKGIIKTEQDEPLLLLADFIAGYTYSSVVYGADGNNDRRELLAAVGPIVERWPSFAFSRNEQSFQESYLIEASVFDNFLPKREREKLIAELKATGLLPQDWVPASQRPMEDD